MSHCIIADVQGQTVQLQHGVLRTNCIDCLDRTNVAQFAHGLTALGQQLHALGLADTPSIEAQSSAAHELMDMYEDMGNVLSRQVCSYYANLPTRFYGTCFTLYHLWMPQRWGSVFSTAEGLIQPPVQQVNR